MHHEPYSKQIDEQMITDGSDWLMDLDLPIRNVSSECSECQGFCIVQRCSRTPLNA